MIIGIKNSISIPKKKKTLKKTKHYGGTANFFLYLRSLIKLQAYIRICIFKKMLQKLKIQNIFFFVLLIEFFFSLFTLTV